MIIFLGGFLFKWKFTDIKIKRDGRPNSKPQKIVFIYSLCWLILNILYLPTIFICEVISVLIPSNFESERFSLTQLISIRISVVLELLYRILVRLFLIPKCLNLKKISKILISSLQQTSSAIRLKTHPTVVKMLTIAILTLCVAIFYGIKYSYML